MDRKENGFTLVELMLMGVIILLLMGLGIPSIRYQLAKSKKKKSISQILRLETALESYKDDMGVYPVALVESEYFGNTALDKTKRSSIIESLRGYDKNETSLSAYWNDPDWHGPYLVIKTGELDASGQFLDPWKQPYLFDGTTTGRLLHNKATFDIVSRGPDKQWDSSTPSSNLNDDNIINWTGDFVAE